MSKINQPYDFLEIEEFSVLKMIIQNNYALLQNDYRALEQYDRSVRMFARDFLRNYLFRKYNGSRSHMDVEQEIRDFEQELYGTQNNSNDQGQA